MTRPISRILYLVLCSLPLWASAGETWLAVGYGGRRMISTDGKTWQITAEWAQPGADDSNNLMSGVYAEEKFVVVGGGGGGATAGGHILVSTDGREWREVRKENSRVNPVIYGNGRFVAGFGGFPSGKLLWSDDGETWTTGAKIEEKGYTHFRYGAYGNGVFVLVGNGGRKDAESKLQPLSWVVVSPDGEKITHEAANLKDHGRIVFGNEHFAMLSRDGVLLTSKDGRDWHEHTLSTGQPPRWLVWTGKEFIAGNSKQSWQSTDAEDWKPTKLPFAGTVLWSDGQRFIGTGWPGRMSFSPDGRVWEKSPELPPNGINTVIYRGEK